jgi:hypothetical protein
MPTKEERRQQAQDHPPSWAQMYGDDLGPSMFTDPAPTPAKGSSARHHARRVREHERDAAERHDLRQLGAAAIEDQQERELARAIDLIQRKKRVPATTRTSAMAALRARGAAGLSSAEQHAANYFEGSTT